MWVEMYLCPQVGWPEVSHSSLETEPPWGVLLRGLKDMWAQGPSRKGKALLR